MLRILEKVLDQDMIRNERKSEIWRILLRSKRPLHQVEDPSLYNASFANNSLDESNTKQLLYFVTGPILLIKHTNNG